MDTESDQRVRVRELPAPQAEEQDEQADGQQPCPVEGCDYTGTERGLQIHRGMVHAEPEEDAPPDEPEVVPRQRGESPPCPDCGSGMTVYTTTRNHPFLRTRYWKCLREGCEGTEKTVHRRR